MTGRFKRRLANREQRRRFLIVLEGAVTEMQYLSAVRRARRIRSADVELIPPGPTSPMEIVAKALDLKRGAAKQDGYDEVWCVFDAEAKITQIARPNLLQALAYANTHKISVALSNPCFELWLLLHAEDCFGWIDSQQAQSRCGALGMIKEKHLPQIARILEQYERARNRAAQLEEMHNRNMTTNPIQRNPSTRVYLLVDTLFAAFK